MKDMQSRRRIAAALEDAVHDQGQRSVGEMVGHANSTISRWGVDLGYWSADALICMIESDSGVLRAMEQLIEAVKGRKGMHSRDVELAVTKVMADSGQTVSVIGEAMMDRKIDDHERKEIAKHLRERMRSIEAALTTLEDAVHV